MLRKTESFLQGSYELARDHKQQQSKEENKLLKTQNINLKGLMEDIRIQRDFYQDFVGNTLNKF